MAVGFRKSLLGFNCDDVMKYIENTHKSFSEKETVLNNKITELDNTLASLNSQLEAIKAAKESVEAELKQYTDKYEEIERLSQNIGKLYLVAQANAQAIMANSEENANLANSEVEKNLSAINDAHESLDSLRKSVIQTSNEFLCEIDGLISSLNETKETIAANIASDEEHKNQFNEVFRTLTK